MNLAVPNALYQGSITDKDINIHALDVLAKTLSREYQHWFTAYRFTFDDVPEFYQFSLIIDGEITPVRFYTENYSNIDLQSLYCRAIA
jgi:hypothetical protein